MSQRAGPPTPGGEDPTRGPVAIVAVKPSGVVKGRDIYTCPSSLFVPSPRSVLSVAHQLVASLPVPVAPDASEVERCANEFGLNALGGCFLLVLRMLGLRVSYAFSMRLGVVRMDVLSLVYPDLLAQMDPERKRAILRHNSGMFKVFTVVPEEAVELDRLLELLSTTKRRFRESVEALIACRQGSARDRIVHIPSTADELVRHVTAFRRAATSGAAGWEQRLSVVVEQDRSGHSDGRCGLVTCPEGRDS